jgi:hypothetical protein
VAEVTNGRFPDALMECLARNTNGSRAVRRLTSQSQIGVKYVGKAVKFSKTGPALCLHAVIGAFA